jgi:nickel/cobalt exporter
MEILTAAIIISLLHALIPNHWLPILAIGKKNQWSIGEVTEVTFLTALAHISSTLIIGLGLGWAGNHLVEYVEDITHWIAPCILILMGIVYIYRHYKHRHFHLHGGPIQSDSKKAVIVSLSLAMFLSPCMEIEALFLMAGIQSIFLLFTVGLVYSFITLAGMIILVRIAYKGLNKFDSHKIEHNAGIITGITLVLTGIASYFIH